MARWTTVEDSDLMEEAKDGMLVEDIADRHRRSVKAIQIRLVSNILGMVNDKNSVEEMREIYHVPEEYFLIHKSFKTGDVFRKNRVKESQIVCNPQPVNVSIELSQPVNESVELLKEIRDLLKIIASK